MAIISDYRSGTSGLIDTSDATTYTFTAADIGTPTRARHVLVGVNGRGAANRTINSFTIAGVAATETGAMFSTNGNQAAFYMAAVPTETAGATGNIVFTLDAAWVRCQIAVWALRGVASLTAFDRQTDATFSTNVLSTSMSCPPGGAIYALANNIGDSSNDSWNTWTGVTERFDAELETQGAASGGSSDFASGQSGYAVSARRVGGSGADGCFLAISLTGTATAKHQVRPRRFLRHGY